MFEIGKNIQELDTPSLWVDLDKMDTNIQMLAQYFRKAGVSWRPHTKGIKIPAIAHKLIQNGAIGITCSKLSEAEVMAASGIKNILIGSQVVGDLKVRHLAQLQHHAMVIVAVDSLENAAEISRAGLDAGVKIPILIELNIGMNRCGIQPGSNTVDFIRQLSQMPGLEIKGLMGWEGHVVQMQDLQEKETAIQKAVGSLVESAELCRKAGFVIEIVSCGGSGSFRFSSHISGVTEIEAGGAIFGDIFCRNAGAGASPAMFIQATVASHPSETAIIIDAGNKAINASYFLPEFHGIQGLKLVRLSAEHGVAEISDTNLRLKIGDKVTLIPGYGDLTVFLYDKLYGVRNGKVEIVWDILGRGKIT